MIATCAKLCEDSYNDKAPGFVNVGDFRYGVFETDHGTIICIRGTANASNWVTDSRVLPTRSCGGYLAHKGFVSAYRELCSGGMPTIKGQNIIATGHSLGGAIATLLAEHTGCMAVTFGSPRVYWRFGKAPQIRHIRVVRDDDPVPMVPKFMYQHSCEPLLIPDDDRHIIQVGDHFMAGYVRAVSKLKGVLCTAP